MGNHLIITNGTIIDGTGSPAYVGDVHISDGVITAIGPAGEPVGAVDPRATVIDATGLLVTPGWVDIHTHYDGQVTWDDLLAPTAWHGVTTLVMGNCGVGFALCSSTLYTFARVLATSFQPRRFCTSASSTSMSVMGSQCPYSGTR